jgi:hypothetical protein
MSFHQNSSAGTNLPLMLYPRSRNSETPTFYQNYLAMWNTTDVTGGKPIAVLLQSIADVTLHAVGKHLCYRTCTSIMVFYLVGSRANSIGLL